ncbi:hypothetical protein R4Z10_19760 [Niallia sp. XMNu-256]|uniref:hypothetical protein n=1 Tax=Niallia sp. XMNu-256 TaxID=3082444 RepID=UPI0030CF7C5F
MAKNKGKAPMVSGSFQVVDDEHRTESLEQMRKDNHLDEQTEHYARIFMED